ncbi:MAG: hypothetical protein ACYC3I_00125 [Gemmataceae bacterium]
MPYFVDISAGPVASFLEDEQKVSPAMRRALEDSLELHLGELGDEFCLSERFRIRGASRIPFQLIITDPETRRPRVFRVIASDASAQVGVLRVLYLDEVTA